MIKCLLLLSVQENIILNGMVSVTLLHIDCHGHDVGVFLAGGIFIIGATHPYMSQGLKSRCSVNLEAMMQMALLPDFKLFGRLERRHWIQKLIATIRPATEAMRVIQTRKIYEQGKQQNEGRCT